MENQCKFVEYEGQCMKVCDCDKCKIKTASDMRLLKWNLIWLGIMLGAVIVAAVVCGALGIC